jgi:hypothetical protein
LHRQTRTCLVSTAIVALVTLLMIAGFLFVISPVAGDIHPHPTDAELIRQFYTQRAALEELQRMFAEDGGDGRIASNFTRDISLSVEGWRAYQIRFADLRMPLGVEGYRKCECMMFIVSVSGLSVSGSAKGYYYSVTPPEPIVAQLDNPERAPILYRHIEGNWYLYYST